MDDFKIWIYVIIGVIYVISRVLKKNDQRNKDTRPANPYGETPSSDQSERPKTFEELLKEITEGKTQQQSPPKPYNKPQTVVKPAPQRTATPGKIRDVREDRRSLEDVTKDERKSLEDVNYDYRKHDNVYEVYENAKKQAFLQPSLEETIKLQDTDMTYGKFKEFDQTYKPSVLEQYVAELKDPEGYKKAFVLSEVLNRKF